MVGDLFMNGRTFDVIGISNAGLLNPSLFGLPAGLDVTGSCLTTGTPPSCSGFAFFGPVHPTTALAGVLGNKMIAAIPEQGTALLLATTLAVQRVMPVDFRVRLGLSQLRPDPRSPINPGQCPGIPRQPLV